MQNWSPIEIYNKLATYCFVTEPLKRGCFSHLVQVIEGVLNDDEKLAYKELTDQYASMRELLLDETNRFKRSISQYKKDGTEANYSKFTEKTPECIDECIHLNFCITPICGYSVNNPPKFWE